MKTLDFYSTTEIDELAWPEENYDLTIDSSALLFFTDFKNNKPLVVESTIPVLTAKELMQKEHVRLKFVIDEKKHFIGVVSSDDIIERKIVQKVSEGLERAEIVVADLMTAKKNLKALDWQDISKATISDVITALKNNGERHCLVLDRENHEIRGIFSASDISRRLRLNIDIQEKTSFSKVFTATL
ncbi:MAG: CBS domain-containing protein [Gammaproteobacteria bacterium]|uniref:CBS domain-containing protein n=1 Tax=Marinomonas polaris DSM 16579 TaxID=1122206 RepID=A0A1M5CTG3_9GAMM|nr:MULTISPECIES: CBS domain-containing protein [Marinomonas]MBU1293539.1 CBS domain-containing protein [Gammaproteobacteria bacterium]MBU1468859.1 CBS domain-containing protein [Gammaproteobacteria bacterium]MBU2023597.1 CBS domain-containing protein [Gammaproteobacteria bacterium]MBU2238231.1 CBS domain-containing protein [Gammaproteobacteria bacterium]MBU2318158.1 CBS domain-containing protein [Gammaproteobacteria bacterium]|tara:strand:- start:4787 stop:5344 length:558 start_codon:yes stop_codon:yes gene_type:complete